MEEEDTLTGKVKAYIDKRATDKLEDFDKKAEKKKGTASPDDWLGIAPQLAEEREQLQQRYLWNTWLTDAAKRAKQINLVTHAPKFTHSDTRSMGILSREENESPSECYLASSSLKKPEIDVVGNAAALDVAGLLQLQADGISLLDEIATGHSATLKGLADSEEQYQEWLQGFSLALQSSELASGQLSKQIYFPVAEGYHLLSPLYATSLSQALYQRLTHTAYSDEAKAARQARKKGLFHPATVAFYPNVAQQSFGGTKPQNISKLNTSRYGRGFLLSCQPPVWQRQVKRPVTGKRSFWAGYTRRCRKTADFLKSYLERIYEQPSIKERRDFRGELVDELIDTLLLFAAEIQGMKEQAGWSRDCELSRAEQLWLDPYRGAEDADFRLEREQNDWQPEIAQQFASWLNHKIGDKSKKLFPDDKTHHEWTRLLKRKLALLKEDLEVAL